MSEATEKIFLAIVSGAVVIAYKQLQLHYRNRKRNPSNHEIWQVFKVTNDSISLYSGYNNFRTQIVRDYNILVNRYVEEMCIVIYKHRYMPNNLFRQFVLQTAAETVMQVTYELTEKFGPKISGKLKTASVTGRDRMYMDIESAIKNKRLSNNEILYTIFSDVVKYLKISEKANLVMHGMINGDLKGESYTNYGGTYINE